jgi:vacuolar-type H+-ATPase subunit H
MSDTTASKPKTRKPAAKPKPAEPVVMAPAKEKFSKALEEAKAGAQALGQEAQERASAYREQMHSKSEEWQSQAKDYSEQAKVKASELANDGKAKASSAIASFGNLVADNASFVDEKLGPKYGEYARTAARSMKDTAEKLDAKNIDELGEDAREMVRKSPGLAVGIAAAAGFMDVPRISGLSCDRLIELSSIYG